MDPPPIVAGAMKVRPEPDRLPLGPYANPRWAIAYEGWLIHLVDCWARPDEQHLPARTHSIRYFLAFLREYGKESAAPCAREYTWQVLCVAILTCASRLLIAAMSRDSPTMSVKEGRAKWCKGDGGRSERTLRRRIWFGYLP